MKLFVTGDCHGDFSRFFRRDFLTCLDRPNEIGIIVLGDFSVNFYLNNTDTKKKEQLADTQFTYYIVRGNHEQHPELLPHIRVEYNKDIDGLTCYEKEYPNIQYLVDGEIYTFGKYRVLVIGGAYSVDKYYRLKRAGLTGNEPHEYIEKKAGWFPNEQLTPTEMKLIEYKVKELKQPIDFVLSHTCPFSWMPRDLFIGALNQSTIDNTMELWMDKLKDSFDWNIWLFGHYHDDRIIRPHVEMYYNDIEDIDVIWNRWNDEKTFYLEWWLKKDPAFYYDDHPHTQNNKGE